MDKKTLVVVVVAAMVIGGCEWAKSPKKEVVPQTLSNVSVITASSPAAAYPKGSTYAFVKLAEDSELTGEAAMIDKRIEKALTDELKKKGYKPGDYAGVGFFVVYTIGVQHEMDVLVAKSKEQGHDWMAAVVMPRDYVNGALLVQVIDAKKMEPVWLGVFNADIQLVSVDEQAKRERVTYAVHEVLKSFPPK